ncbi:gamma-glutamyl hydrolase precursor [Mus musculus]|uniref:Gamma-glutamyl hydrolase n=1 Tax=Mus musculus TaxID=10090 RepID=GGH_MOUSE|nr:gamma-glutamyl hydrolase precursor [Mus musculus]Q9Z0L8.2 RecName: Full=Gamma-glutamyl hydrolase; AltName: Full=Conjugase; AltName: Full=FGPH; AltName: Full=Folylpolyglutamate hydrolase; AltName: Full=GH; AltName: Full=Gamma-Glu-x carboxypeptidase; Flags: Precursor [Mus musculus]|eukprot:NP_034411.2 gamma-glutamyl hydrolase precursor [Mus musculus]
MANLGYLLCLLGLLLCGLSSPGMSRPYNHGSERPIIGVVMQECFGKMAKLGNYYIAASYVKYIESAGARVVPIRPDLSDAEYEELFRSINGVLLPGGGANLTDSGYSRVAKIFFSKALESFDNGDHFPVWGTCLGFEELSVLVSGENLLTSTDTKSKKLPLNFTEGARKSRMFKHFPTELLDSLALENLTANFHKWSLSVKNFTENEKLKKFFNILTTNTDGKTEFISSMEGFKYPVYAVQWHPEKAAFEWKNLGGISHAPNAVKTSFYLAEFLVSEARKNSHHFENVVKETASLIYKFNPIYTGNISSFQQAYMFD